MMPHMLGDTDLKEFDYRMSKTITMMPEEVQDRFKALKCLYVNCFYKLIKIRIKSVSLMRKRRLSTVHSSSSMTNSTKRFMLSAMRSSLVPSPLRRSCSRCMRLVPRNLMTKTTRSWNRYPVM